VLFKGKFCTLEVDGDKVRFKDPHRVIIRSKAEITALLRASLDEELSRVEELHKAIEKLEALPAKPVTTVKPKRYPPGASGIKRAEE
jgi:hypothetical protein